MSPTPEPTTPELQRPRRGRPKGRFNYSKRFLRASSATRALRASIEVYKDDVAAKVGERLAPELADGEVLPDHALSLELVGRSVERQLEHLRASERRYIEAQTRCAATRRESKEVARDEVYGQVVGVRRLIDSQFGKEAGFEIHRMKGKTLRKPRRLHVQVDELVHALGAETPLPEPLLEGLKVDRKVWLKQIEPGYRRLSAVLEELLHLELETQRTRIEKDAALDAFDAAYGDALRLMQATLAFAGCSPGMLKSLRAYVQRRLLARRAREKRQARAGGRLQKTRAALRTVTSSLAGWLGRRVA